MPYGELSLGPEIPQKMYDPHNGRFLPGHIPATKGKKWSEYMSEEAQAGSRKGWVNLKIHRPTHRSTNAGRPKKPIVALMPDGKLRKFLCVQDAVREFGGRTENICRCCRQNQARTPSLLSGKVNTDHYYLGIRFYFREDQQWFQKWLERK